MKNEFNVEKKTFFNFSRFLVIFGLVILNYSVIGQISVNLPLKRMVFQRNNSQQGNIIISGNYQSNISLIEAKVTPISAGSGVATTWATVQSNPSNGYFTGSITAAQGWYMLEVRGSLNGTVINTIIRAKVGIGEVFAIAGQSNAQGGASNGFGANDDRVNSVKYSNDYSNYNKLPLGFSQLSVSSQIAPFHYVPWAWGILGDLLAARLNVPILFYGAGHGDTSSLQWGNSAQGLPFDGPSWVQQPLGAPYRALENSVAYYASLTGLRAVLWQQGESDPDTGPTNYFNNIVAVINRTRTNTEHANLAWVVALSSLNPSYHQNVIEGQSILISNHPNVFQGPNTDLIQGGNKRSDGIHFDLPEGLTDLANAWDTSLNSSFFANSTPMMASPLVPLSIACTPSNLSTPLSITAPAGYAQYAWSNRQNSSIEAQGVSNNCCTSFTFYPPSGYEAFNWQQDSTNAGIGANTGRFAMNVRKVSRKTLFSPVLNITVASPPNTPIITASANQIRPSQSIILSTTCTNSWPVWSSGNTNSPITLTPSSTTNYTVQCKNPFCLGSPSSPKTIVVSTCFSTALALNGSVIATEPAYQSQLTIESIQKLESTGKTDYNALKNIELKPGFEAKQGSTFKALIVGCN
jgi:Carbohydrate esterase, sialic acid-specific acetylesterase